jgi:CubicO group peptidase (beta-lactamase class C family)
MKTIFTGVFCLITVLLSAICSEKLNAAPAETFSRLDGSPVSLEQTTAFLQDAMQRHGVPGLSIAIINDGQVRYYSALGKADIENKAQVTEQTLFEGASLSKPLFAYFVMGFVESGKLNLDKPLWRYLRHPDLPLDKNARALTARMVLSHTSGLPNWRIDLDDKKLRFIAAPGSGHTYSGEAYQYLAMVLAKIEKTDARGLDKLFQQRVLQPLGMDHSYFFLPTAMRQNKAMPYQGGKRIALNPIPTEFGAAYALETEAQDYAKWIIALMNRQKQKPNTFEQYFKGQETLIPADHPERALGLSDWALGWSIYRTEDQKVVYVHGGNNEGYTSLAVFSLEQRWGVVFFTNANQATNFQLEVFGYLGAEPR